MSTSGDRPLVGSRPWRLAALVAALFAAPGWGQVEQTSQAWLDLYSSGLETRATFSYEDLSYTYARYETVRHLAVGRDGTLRGTITRHIVGDPSAPATFDFSGSIESEWLQRVRQSVELASLPQQLGNCSAKRSIGRPSIAGLKAPSYWQWDADEFLTFFDPAAPSGTPGSYRLVLRQSDATGGPWAACPDELLDLLSELESGMYDQLEQVVPSPCDAGSDAFELLDGRFRVDVCWRLADGTRGTGKLGARLGEGASVWFFNPANPELLLKVKNACIDPYQRYWFFASGLTTVSVGITVTDNQTGEQHSYGNRWGSPFDTIADLASFDTCP